MRKFLYLLLLTTAGCYYQSYAVRRPLPAEPPISREEVERLTLAGVTEPVLSETIEQRGAFPLTPDDLVSLKKAGTADAVVQKMIACERKMPEMAPPEEGYAGPYAYPPYAAYYYPYYYYPSVGFGWGWGWGYRGYARGYAGVRVY